MLAYRLGGVILPIPIQKTKVSILPKTPVTNVNIFTYVELDAFTQLN
jgi:hypothetical protein